MPFQLSLKELDQSPRSSSKDSENQLASTELLDKNGIIKETRERDSRRKEKLPKNKTDYDDLI